MHGMRKKEDGRGEGSKYLKKKFWSNEALLNILLNLDNFITMWKCMLPQCSFLFKVYLYLNWMDNYKLNKVIKLTVSTFTPNVLVFQGQT